MAGIKDQAIMEAVGVFRDWLNEFVENLEKESVEFYQQKVLSFSEAVLALPEKESRKLRKDHEMALEALKMIKRSIRLFRLISQYLNRGQYEEVCQPLGEIIRTLQVCGAPGVLYEPLKNMEVFFRENFFVAKG